MVRYATKFGIEHPYTIPNKGPTPKIDKEEGLPLGKLDIAWVKDSIKKDYHWSRGLKWYERLHAHATLNSARKNVKCKRPFEPKDSLDLLLDAVYCPTLGVFFNKTDPCLQKDTVFDENSWNNENNKNTKINKRNFNNKTFSEEGGFYNYCNYDIRKPFKFVKLSKKTDGKLNFESGSWRLLRNRVYVYPDVSVPRNYPIIYSMGGVERRENIHSVKLGIATDHSPQTNPGYSRTPCGAFYSI
ncbi:hypothetical protein Phum_PHUM530170 [Pediculus humanus corporis]|uniref:Uncharacterized protein n=1 Tax=Pediculus humanus subsp. corporis TaxID=121224 RepID=E0VZC6_PEDHC|nr:uncharacterized protein Phum_PHUM530170 [Pediculus humanus corporis]EEB18732.1 hypothetical protein Phum_PHUM530170 [Pediculus humanus corporis]